MSPHKPSAKLSASNQNRTSKKERKSRATRKAKDAPRRPLSAYNLYFKYQRVLMLTGGNDSKSARPGKDMPIVVGGSYSGILSAAGHTVVQPSEGFRTVQGTCKREHKRTHGKVSFVELARQIGQKWQALDEAARSPFVHQARLERERYREEVARYRERKKASLQGEVIVACSTSTNYGTEPKEVVDRRAESVSNITSHTCITETTDIEPVGITSKAGQFLLSDEIWNLELFAGL